MKSKAQIKFEEERKDLSDREVQMEVLYSNFLNYQTNEKIRQNTSKLVNIVVLGIIFSIIVSVGLIAGV